MDEKRPGYNLKAPGASGASALHLPGRAGFPGLDEHLVAPEVSRDEVIKGRRVVAHPALEAHGDKHGELDFVVRGSSRVGGLRGRGCDGALNPALRLSNVPRSG